MIASVYEVVTKPSDCAFVSGLPVTKEDFYRVRETKQSDYTSRFWHWPEYCDEFVDDYQSLKDQLLQQNVKVLDYASIDDFRGVWDRDYHAVVLFSHWNERGIEYRDGLVECETIAATIPQEIIAILDLCVCHPQALVRLLNASHSKLLTKAIWKSADPKYWCMFYKALFLLLQNQEFSYPDALDEITNAFLSPSTPEE